MHKPVLLNETIELLDLRKGKIVLDATIDGGGHAMEILQRITPEGKLLGIDQDREMLDFLLSKTEFLDFKEKGNMILVNGNFGDMRGLVARAGVEKVDCVLLDLGMSSFHLDKAGRGFSFKGREPLLMNYKTVLGPEDLTAAEILNKWPEEEIKEILREYGEERYAGRIAGNIIDFRKKKVFENTEDLKEAVWRAVPPRYRRGRIHCATRTFQALRIAVNDELGVLSEGLSEAWKLIEAGGRIAVISFHSLEDRIVKNFFKEKKENEKAEILTKKPVVPSERERRENPRARSAKLRAILKK